VFLSETELAFAENLILIGRVPAPKVIYLLRSKELHGDERMLWEIAADLGLTEKQALNDSYMAASEAVDESGEQAFSFSEGAMIGPWELGERKVAWVGGEVWLARQGLGKQALLRLVPPGSGSDHERQARFVERSNPGLDPPHPTILKVDEAGEDFGWLYTASESAAGQMLAEILGNGALAERSALGFAHGLANTLRDAKPHLTDFGVSSALLDGPAEGNRPGGRLGVLLFSSPALIAGDAERGLDARDDLYGLGCLLYLLLCNPQDGDQPVDGQPWFAEPHVSPNTRELLMRLIAGQTAAYPTAGSLLRDLGAVAQGVGPGPLPPEQSARGRRAPSSTAQVALGWDGEDVEDVEDDEDDEDDEAPPPRRASSRLGKASSGRHTASGSRKLGKASSGKIRAGKSGKLGKTSGSRLGSVSSRRQVPVAKGAGWGVLFGTLLVLGGGAAMAAMVTQPKGAEQARVTLAQAFRAARKAPVAYDVVVDLTERALKEAGGDVEVSRDALRLRRATLAAAWRERISIVGDEASLPAPSEGEAPREGDGEGGSPGEGESAAEAPAAPAGGDDVVAKLRDLRERLTNTDLAPRIDYDITSRKTTPTVPLVWAEQGMSLLEAGHAAAALDALTKGSRPEKTRAALASRMAFLRGGAYLVPNPDGEGLVLVRRPPVYVGRTEVTRGEYRSFLGAIAAQENPHEFCDQTEPDGKSHEPDGWGLAAGPDDDLPATGLDYYDAVAYASRLGGRLADAETLAAATRGPLGLERPWGRAEPSLSVANFGDQLGGKPTPVGSFPGGAGEGGALDLLGNVAEWVKPSGDEMKPTEAPVWGGHCKTAAADLKPEALEELKLEARNELTGFRILLDVKASE
jgi:formylglycine-generating enzyme required for sulfatase activity